MNHHHESGRIVIDVDPPLKRRLYASLSLSGSTLKDWFVKAADSYAATQGLSNPVSLGQMNPRPFVQPETHAIMKKRKEKTPNGASSNKKHSVISMFSGCGGMDLGFQGGFTVFGRHYQELPYDIVWANDLNEIACRTYRRNLGHDSHPGDIWSLLDTMPGEADVVIGGFPCQDISVNGKRAGLMGQGAVCTEPWLR